MTGTSVAQFEINPFICITNKYHIKLKYCNQMLHAHRLNRKRSTYKKYGKWKYFFKNYVMIRNVKDKSSQKEFWTFPSIYAMTTWAEVFAHWHRYNLQTSATQIEPSISLCKDKPQTYCVITYAAADMAGEKAAGVSTVSIHAWWWFGSCCVEVVMCLDPDPDPASHNVNLACDDRLEGYLPVVGPGKSLAVAMVADSDSSKGRWGEQQRDKKRWPQRSKETREFNMVCFPEFLHWRRVEVTESKACCQSRMHA